MGTSGKRKIGLWAAVSLGIGGMVGGGIFAVLGLAVQLAGGGTPLAFALAGCVALLTAYSYARLSVVYPNRGGTVGFLNRAFGTGLWPGSLNVLLWLSYVVMLSLYSFAFGSYGATFLPEAWQPAGRHVLISLCIIVMTVLNLAAANVVGRAEDWIVGLKLLILALFVAVGLGGIEWARIEPATWSPPLALAAGGMIIFLAFEGFELIANTAEDMEDPARTLPRAYYISVGFVILLYVLVALVTVGNLPVAVIVAAKDYALAAAARPLLGETGFSIIAMAAMLSTASAVNATLYGTTRLSYSIANEGELPSFLTDYVWGRPVVGLLITSALTLVTANLFDLTSISTMGSAGFLLIFAAVNVANAKMASQTRSRRWLSVAGAVACIAALAALLWQVSTVDPNRLVVLAVMLAVSIAIEMAYRSVGRHAPR